MSGNQASALGTSATTSRRPLGLALVLIVLAAATTAGSIYGLTHRAEFFAQFPRFTPWLWGVYLCCAFAGIAAQVAMWFWKKWGLWLTCALSGLVFAIELYTMGPGLHLVRIVVALGLLAFFVRPVWGRFR